jgi:uncharacterized protein (TIGR02246 family)
MQHRRWVLAFVVSGMVELLAAGAVRSEPIGPRTPEAVVRQAVLANERRDLEGMAQLFLKDPDIESFGIAGLKFVGWNDLEQTLRNEFQSVSHLEIVIKNLKLWSRDEVAWFAMELDYTRMLPGASGQTRMTLELRETGVLEKRDGRWRIHSWHESTRQLPSRRFASTTAGASEAQASRK